MTDGSARSTQSDGLLGALLVLPTQHSVIIQRCIHANPISSRSFGIPTRQQAIRKGHEPNKPLIHQSRVSQRLRSKVSEGIDRRTQREITTHADGAKREGSCWAAWAPETDD